MFNTPQLSMLPSQTAASAPAQPIAANPSAELCRNCEQSLADGHFCPHCGQPRPHRLSVAHVLHELVHVFTHADKSIFGFAGHVLLRPGRVVADYLAGRRKRYFNPFQFLLIAVGIATLLSTQSHFYEQIGDDLQRSFQARGLAAEQVARVGKYFHLLGKYFNVWWLALLPFHTLTAWAVYRRRGLNYAEAFLTLVVVGCAFQVYMILLLAGVALLELEPGSASSLLQVAVYAVYLTWIGRQGLKMSWLAAGLSALIVVAVAGCLNYGVNMLAFSRYVFGK